MFMSRRLPSISCGLPPTHVKSQWGMARNVSRISGWIFIASRPVDDAGNVLQLTLILQDQQPARLVAFEALTR